MTNNHTTTKPKNVRSRRRSANLLPIALVGVVSLNVTPCALAQEPTQLNAVMVVGDKSAVPTNVPSTTEAHRNLEQGGVRVDGDKVADKGLKLAAGSYVVQVGKRRFARVTLS